MKGSAPRTALTRRTLLMTALGTPVMAAICIGLPVLVSRFWGTSVPGTGFWISTAIFGGFSVLALGIVLGAALRVRRTGDRGIGAAVALWSPYLMLAGGVAGFFIAGRIADYALDLRARSHAMDCARVVNDDAMAACLLVMMRCDISTRDGAGIVVDRSGKLSVPWPEGLKVPDSPMTRARVLCAWRALRAAATTQIQPPP
ncbi:MAG: hypothetical protein ACI9U2_001770 [Bradymonadia bacterium]|jgi:hypothetical protein